MRRGLTRAWRSSPTMSRVADAPEPAAKPMVALAPGSRRWGGRLGTARAMAALCWARLLIAVVPFHRWRRRLGGPRSPDITQSAEALGEGRRLARQVEWAAQRLPFSTKCLPRAMSLSWI